MSPGITANVFSYDTSPNYLGTTAALTNYDAYVISLTLDYALMSITLVDASIPPPVLAISQLDVGSDRDLLAGGRHRLHARIRHEPAGYGLDPGHQQRGDQWRHMHHPIGGRRISANVSAAEVIWFGLNWSFMA